MRSLIALLFSSALPVGCEISDVKVQDGVVIMLRFHIEKQVVASCLVTVAIISFSPTPWKITINDWNILEPLCFENTHCGHLEE